MLNGYCRAVRATCCLVRDMVLAGSVCEARHAILLTCRVASAWQPGSVCRVRHALCFCCPVCWVHYDLHPKNSQPRHYSLFATYATLGLLQDEDFQPHAFGLMLAEGRGSDGGASALAALSLAEDWLATRRPAEATDPGRSPTGGARGSEGGGVKGQNPSCSSDPAASSSRSGVRGGGAEDGGGGGGSTNGGRPAANGWGGAEGGCGRTGGGADVHAEHVAAYLARIRFRKALLRVRASMDVPQAALWARLWSQNGGSDLCRLLPARPKPWVPCWGRQVVCPGVCTLEAKTAPVVAAACIAT